MEEADPLVDTEDPYLKVGIGIGRELAGIRQQLEELNAKLGGEDGTQDESAYECRCGETVVGDDAAERHAVDDHNAPPDHWREMYETSEA